MSAVNVLEVLAQAERFMAYGDDIAAARAAVAELIEKSAALATAVAEETEYFATHKHLDEASFFENRVVQCTDELRAALGRMGEGA